MPLGQAQRQHVGFRTPSAVLCRTIGVYCIAVFALVHGSSKSVHYSGTDVVIRQCAFPFQTVVSRFLAAIDANENVGLALDFDHAANAGRVGLELEPTRVFLFGNPAVGTAFMQETGAAAVDLPAKALVFSRQGQTFYAYSTAAFLGLRHGLQSPEAVESMRKLDAALKGFAIASCGSQVLPDSGVLRQIRGEAAALLHAPSSAPTGLITKPSAFSVKETLDRLEDAYADAPISTVLRVDHAASARRVGLQLAPTETLLFGNPRLGTPLMADTASIGLDFPQKAAAWTQTSGWNSTHGTNRTMLTYNDPLFFARRHQLPIDEFAELLATIRGALDRLTDQAVGREGQ